MSTARQAKQLRAAGDLAGALRACCEAWRTSRHPDIVRVIEAWSVPALASFDAPDHRTKAQFHAAWMELAESAEPDDPVVTGWLAATFQVKVPLPKGYRILDDAFDPTQSADLARLRALERRAHDPRIVSVLLRQLEEGPWSVYDSRGPVLYQAVVQALAGMGDPRAAGIVAQLAEAPRSSSSSTRDYLSRLLPEWIEPLRCVASEPDDLADWRALAPAEDEPDPRSDELLAQIYEDPHSDELRPVYLEHRGARPVSRGFSCSSSHSTPLGWATLWRMRNRLLDELR